jgi:thymidylate synthase
MRAFNVRNVSEALYVVNQAIREHGVQQDTRNGPALEFPYPIAITYEMPRERVLFYPERDANPFFHLLESMWMLAGRNDVHWIERFNNRMSVYSDNGKTFHGAYGYRWRKHFFEDQLEIVVHRLRRYPNDRRAVLGMWDPRDDLVRSNKNVDLPCNTHIYFRIDSLERLHMTVCNRSNDMIWGALGANAVHMSYLQEYIAAHVGCKVGTYTQFSNNFHAYLETIGKLDGMQPDYDPYLLPPTDGLYPLADLVHDTDKFDSDLQMFIEYTGQNYVHAATMPDQLRTTKNSFFRDVAVPMAEAYLEWKRYKLSEEVPYMLNAQDIVQTIQAPDWRRACHEWLNRRATKAGFKVLAPEEEFGCAGAKQKGPQ